MFKQDFFNKSIAIVITFSLLTTFNTATGASKKKFKRNIPLYNKEQKIYFAEEPLPIIVKKLKSQGMSKTGIIKHLTKKLQKVTPKFAKKEFGIDWIKNSLQSKHVEYLNDELRKIKKITTLDAARKTLGLPFKKLKTPISYPTLVICDMGDHGYGLFTMASIRGGQIIAEYTGEQVEYSGLKKPNRQSTSIDPKYNTGIDSLLSGNASRFAKHLILEKDLSSYEYKMSKSFASKYGDILPNDYIASSNSYLKKIHMQNDERAILFAKKDIKRFEQIGFAYDEHTHLQDAGYETHQHVKKVHLFNKDGKIIPENHYQTTNAGIILADEITEKNNVKLFPLNKFYMEESLEAMSVTTSSINDNYASIKLLAKTDQGDIEHHTFIVDNRVWQEKIAVPKTRMVVPAYPINSDTDIDGFINTLHKTEMIGHSKSKCTEILKVARDNNFEKANKLLDELAKEGYDSTDWAYDL